MMKNLEMKLADVPQAQRYKMIWGYSLANKSVLYYRHLDDLRQIVLTCSFLFVEETIRVARNKTRLAILEAEYEFGLRKRKYGRKKDTAGIVVCQWCSGSLEKCRYNFTGNIICRKCWRSISSDKGNPITYQQVESSYYLHNND